MLKFIRRFKESFFPELLKWDLCHQCGAFFVFLKVCFWLIENGFRVLIAACDTFRAGAVEQLRTHVRKLNALHPPEKHNGQQMVQLYEKGYGKDAAGIAMEAINYGRCQMWMIDLWIFVCCGVGV